MTKFCFFFETEYIDFKYGEEIKEVDDLLFEESDREKLDYSKIKEFFEIINPAILNKFEQKFQKFVPDFKLQKIFETICDFDEIHIQFGIIYFDSQEEFKILQNKINNFLIVIDSSDKIMRRSRFLSNVFIDSKISELFLDRYKGALDHKKIHPRLLSYRDVEGLNLNLRGFSGFSPIYFPMRVDTRLEGQIKKILREDYTNVFINITPHIVNFNLADLRVCSDPILFSELFELLHDYFKFRTAEIYSNLKQVFFINYHLLENLMFTYNKCSKDILLNLKYYFDEMNHVYYCRYPTILFYIFDSFAMSNSSIDSLGRVNYSDHFINSKIYKDYCGVYDSLREFLMDYYQLKIELSRNMDALNNLLMKRESNDILAIYDSLNQSYFLSRSSYEIRLRQIEEFISKLNETGSNVYRYVFVNEISLGQNPQGITYLHNIGWNVISCIKEKKEDYDTRFLAFTQQITKLKLGDWSKVVLICADSDLINPFLGLFKKKLIVITSPKDLKLTNPNFKNINNYGLGLNAYQIE